MKAIDIEKVTESKVFSEWYFFYVMFGENVQSHLGNNFNCFFSYVQTHFGKTDAKIGILDDFKLIFKEYFFLFYL